MKSMQELFNETLRDTYNAEKQIVKALPKLAKAATNPRLKDLLQEHLDQTQNQIQRLEEVSKMLKIRPAGKICHGMEGLILEGNEHIQDFGGNEVGDAALIVCAQKVEHYEIGAYGTLITWAHEMGRQDIADIFKETLGEEEQADQKLSKLAESEVNRQAIQMAAIEPVQKKKTGTASKVSVR